jgi:hypothetical protein
MCTRLFSILKVRKKFAIAEKELQQAKKDNQPLARYVNTKRKNEEARSKEEDAQKKAEQENRKKAMEGQSSKDVWTWSK